MRTIGVTGGIGTGKSTVCSFLEKLGAVIVGADEMGHESYRKGSKTHKELIAAFGKEIVSAGGEIDRKKLGEIVFNNQEARATLNGIVWPKIHEMCKTKLRSMREDGSRVAVLEAAVLVEAQWFDLVDEVWVTVAPQKRIVEWLKKRDGLSREQIINRITSQLPYEAYVRHGDVVIDTNCTLRELSEMISFLWENRILAE